MSFLVNLKECLSGVGFFTHAVSLSSLWMISWTFHSRLAHTSSTPRVALLLAAFCDNEEGLAAESLRALPASLELLSHMGLQMSREVLLPPRDFPRLRN